MHPRAHEDGLRGPRETNAWRRTELLLLALLVATSFVGLSGRRLSTSDESRYAEIAREMLESGDWVTPRLSGVEHWHKPPLTYWAIAASFAAFGLHEFAARLPSALAAAASIIAVYGTGRMLFGRRAGVLGAVVLASSMLFALMGRLATPDMLLTCWTCWAVHCLVRGHAHGDRRGLWAVLRGVFVGLGFMTKGPLIFVFVAVPALLAVLLRRDWRALRASRPWLSAAAFCAIGLPWFVVVCVQNPGMLRYLLEFQTLDRIASDVHARTHSLLYYIPVLAYAFSPWVYLTPYAVAHGAFARGAFGRGQPDEMRVRGAFLALLFVVPLVLLSLSRSKGLAYMLPALPAAALLVGWCVERAAWPADRWPRGFRVSAWIALAGLGLLAAWICGCFFVLDAFPELALLRWYAVLFGVLALLGVAAGAVALVRRINWLLIAALAGPVPATILVVLTTMPDTSGSVSWEATGRHMAEAIAPRMAPGGRVRPGDRLVFYRSTSHSTSFYLRARPVLVGCNVDVRFMAPAEYAEWILDGEPVEALAELFRRAQDEGRRLFCVAKRTDYEQFTRAPDAPSTYLLAERHRTVLFSNRPDPPTDPPASD